jgi:hypothetical protein
MDTKAVRPGVNAFECVCKDGTVFIPVCMHLWARIKAGEKVTVRGKCHLGHRAEFMARA